MAKKALSKYVCSNCGAESISYTGRCWQCGEWNSLQEQLQPEAVNGAIKSGTILKVSSLKQSVSKNVERLDTGIDELNLVLGGGLVRGSVNLLAGQPGIGKSTLLMQVSSNISKKSKVLYVSGEESIHQVGMRAQRLGVTKGELELVNSNSADDVAATISQGNYDLVIVDSIQTIACAGISSNAGSTSQITNSTLLVTKAAKHTNTSVILVGHVTKEGSIAGPKILEHSVDVVLNLEGDRYGGFKVLRAAKNRYGSTEEAGIFEMADKGLAVVSNPSAALLAERQITDGSIVFAALEGNRPVLVEIQALVNKTSFGYPKRASSGFDLNRLNLLAAMLERRTKLNLSDFDIYINVVGGISIKEPAADLAVAMAIASAAKGFSLKQDSVVFGEIGLSGEVRHVPQIQKRIVEANKMGFSSAIGPVNAKAKISNYHPVANVRDAMNKYLDKN